jgi:hypothetical protein
MKQEIYMVPMEQIAVFLCKDFPEVVDNARSQKPYLLETSHGIVEGFLHSFGNTAITILQKNFQHLVDGMVAKGYTVTAYVRLSDRFQFVPIVDEFEMEVAAVVNEKIFEKAFPQIHAN